MRAKRRKNEDARLSADARPSADVGSPADARSPAVVRFARKKRKKRGCERSEKNENASETSGEASGECSLRSQKITNLSGHHPVARTAVAKQSSFCKSHLLLLLSMSKRTLTLWKCNKGNDLQCSIPA